jgi:hypothetical protein
MAWSITNFICLFPPAKTLFKRVEMWLQIKCEFAAATAEDFIYFFLPAREVKVRRVTVVASAPVAPFVGTIGTLIRNRRSSTAP